MNNTHLVMVTPNNNNKFYDMFDDENGFFHVEYGRIGNSHKSITRYPINQWQKKYREKINKGYIDQTDLIKEIHPVESENYKMLDNNGIGKLISYLRECSAQEFNKNYTIRSTDITQSMIDKADKIIEELIYTNDIHKFNNVLIDLFQTVPRKMSNVKDYLATNNDDLKNIIIREQNLLDNLRGHIYKPNITKTKKHNCTILEAYGLEIDDINEEDVKIIKDMLGDSAKLFYKAWKVKNHRTQDSFDKFQKDNHNPVTKFLWHGSKTSNWWSIINSGLKLSPNAPITGKMFGKGVYFASKAKKSIGYTSLKGAYWSNGSSNHGFLALYEVAYGEPYDVYSFKNEYYNLNFNELQKRKKNAISLHAHAGNMLKNDEILSLIHI